MGEDTAGDARGETGTERADTGTDPLSGFRRLGEAHVFDSRVFKVRTVTFADPDGREFDRDIVRHRGAVTIVPVHADGTVTLVRQLRVAVGAALLEAPAGTCDVDGEDPETTARRELEEEAGLQAGRIERLGTVFNSPGYSDQRTLVYLATDVTPCATRPAGVEEQWMTTERVALDDVERLVAGGELLDATTIVGLMLARHALAQRARAPERG
ncbi:MAG TPA: NUDIX hydrolase [Acidimicrobiales bacterium]|nr:NUDIX hydrolase [Acidimicrobiales bacterium]